ncbi:hypothetical protein ACGYKB_18540 [Sulfitobacter sp. 916]|uniref:hypothetical protein n=1 Tax=Sulfitobacter sp. 916 TaxID=3368559 RepID=UPI003745DEFC
MGLDIGFYRDGEEVFYLRNHDDFFEALANGSGSSVSSTALSSPCNAGSLVGPFLSAGGKVVSAALGFCTLRVFCSMFG